jgi:hypothetical protein
MRREQLNVHLAFSLGDPLPRGWTHYRIADLEEDWRNHGKEIFPILRKKYPQAYFQGIVSLPRIIPWDVESTDAFDRTMTPEEIMDKLEERVGPEGRRLFEEFLRKVNKLGAKQNEHAIACWLDDAAK